jgi:hypothetical protein
MEWAMLHLHKKKKTQWAKRGILLVLVIGFFQIIIFSDISHAAINIDSVPYGFRTHSEKKAIEKVEPGNLIPETVREAQPVVLKRDKQPVENVVPPFSNGAEKITVPNLIGRTKENAIFFIGKSGLMIGSIFEKTHESIAIGKVIAQTPESGNHAVPDSPVGMIISSGPATSKEPLIREFTQQAKMVQPGILRWKDKPLGEILDEVHLKSGINFIASDYIKAELITVEFYASNWNSAIRKLLKGFSIVGISDSNGNLVQVRIMSDGRYGKTISTNSPKTTGQKTKIELGQKERSLPGSLAKNMHRPEIKKTLSKVLYAKLNDIKAWPVGQPLPASMYNDADLKPFLIANGIESEKDLEHSIKIKDLNRAVRKELLLMKKRALAKDIVSE